MAAKASNKSKAKPSRLRLCIFWLLKGEAEGWYAITLLAILVMLALVGTLLLVGPPPLQPREPGLHPATKSTLWNRPHYGIFHLVRGPCFSASAGGLTHANVPEPHAGVRARDAQP